MTTELTDVIDIALSRLMAGETPAAILADYPAERATLYPLLNTAEIVKKITPAEIPAPETLATDRNAFLSAL